MPGPGSNGSTGVGSGGAGGTAMLRDTAMMVLQF